MGKIAGYGFRFGVADGVSVAGGVGKRGPQGLRGLQGVKGDRGLQGLAGQKGDTGLRGIDGKTGEQGIMGPSGWNTGLLSGLVVPASSRHFYIFSDENNRTMSLSKVRLTDGWNIFICNETQFSILTITGDFQGDISQIAILPQTGIDIVFYSGGDYFVTCPSRKSTDISMFKSWESNPMRAGTEYTEPVSSQTWSTGANSLDLTDANARTHLHNKLIQIRGLKAEFTLNLPSILRENLNGIAKGDGYSFENLGNAILLLKPNGSDMIRGPYYSYDNTRPMKLPIITAITIVKQADAKWNIINISGHNPEGGF